MNIWEDKESLDKLEQVRTVKRKSGRLTFDCLNLRCKDDRAYCSKGKLLGRAKDGSLDLLTVLRGMTSGTCKGCGDYSSDEE